MDRLLSNQDQTSWISSLVPSLTGYVTLSKNLKALCLVFQICKVRITKIPAQSLVRINLMYVKALRLVPVPMGPINVGYFHEIIIHTKKVN